MFSYIRWGGSGGGGQHSSNMSQFNMISHQVSSDSDTARDDTGVRDGRRLIEYHGWSNTLTQDSNTNIFQKQSIQRTGEKQQIFGGFDPRKW